MRPWRAWTPILLLGLLEATSPAAGGQDTAAAVEVEREGSIRGHVSVPDISFDTVEALLLPPEWALEWRGEVQRRLDAYSDIYRRAVAADRGLFSEISQASYREATLNVLARMQAAMGDGFEAMSKEVSSGGLFEYSGLPYGDYTVVVLAREGIRGMIWAESFSISGSVPEILEIENRIQ